MTFMPALALVTLAACAAEPTDESQGSGSAIVGGDNVDSSNLKQGATIRFALTAYEEDGAVIGPVADTADGVSTFSSITFAGDGTARYTTQLAGAKKEGSFMLPATAAFRVAAYPRSVPSGQRGLKGTYAYRLRVTRS